MSKKVDKAKIYLKKALVLQSSMGENERKELEDFLDKLEVEYSSGEFFVDDATPCECEERLDIVEVNDKKYCLDCLHFIEGKKKKD